MRILAAMARGMMWALRTLLVRLRMLWIALLLFIMGVGAAVVSPSLSEVASDIIEVFAPGQTNQSRNARAMTAVSQARDSASAAAEAAQLEREVALDDLASLRSSTDQAIADRDAALASLCAALSDEALGLYGIATDVCPVEGPEQ